MKLIKSLRLIKKRIISGLENYWFIQAVTYYPLSSKLDEGGCISEEGFLPWVIISPRPSPPIFPDTAWEHIGDKPSDE